LLCQCIQVRTFCTVNVSPVFVYQLRLYCNFHHSYSKFTVTNAEPRHGAVCLMIVQQVFAMDLGSLGNLDTAGTLRLATRLEAHHVSRVSCESCYYFSSSERVYHLFE